MLLTDRPFVGPPLSAGLAVFDVWVVLMLSYFAPNTPTSFWIMAVAAATYPAAVAYSRISKTRPPKAHSAARPRATAAP